MNLQFMLISLLLFHNPYSKALEKKNQIDPDLEGQDQILNHPSTGAFGLTLEQVRLMRQKERVWNQIRADMILSSFPPNWQKGFLAALEKALEKRHADPARTAAEFRRRIASMHTPWFFSVLDFPVFAGCYLLVMECLLGEFLLPLINQTPVGVPVDIFWVLCRQVLSAWIVLKLLLFVQITLGRRVSGLILEAFILIIFALLLFWFRSWNPPAPWMMPAFILPVLSVILIFGGVILSNQMTRRRKGDLSKRINSSEKTGTASKR